MTEHNMNVKALISVGVPAYRAWYLAQSELYKSLVQQGKRLAARVLQAECTTHTGGAKAFAELLQVKASIHWLEHTGPFQLVMSALASRHTEVPPIPTNVFLTMYGHSAATQRPSIKLV